VDYLNELRESIKTNKSFLQRQSRQVPTVKASEKQYFTSQQQPSRVLEAPQVKVGTVGGGYKKHLNKMSKLIKDFSKDERDYFTKMKDNVEQAQRAMRRLDTVSVMNEADDDHSLHQESAR